MTPVVDKFKSLLPARAKTSPSGWTSFNAPCCHHRGHKQDTRKRAGVRFDSGIVYNCFNCKFSTGWQPGSVIGEKMKALLRWMGASEDDIKQLVFESLKTEPSDITQVHHEEHIAFTEKPLPEFSKPISEWVNDPLLPEIADEIGKVIEYLVNRNVDPLNPNFYWSPDPSYADRVIIPFKFQGKVVGHTARKVVDGRPKYIADQQPHFVFNLDAQADDQKYILVVEGPFDALAVNGVALLHNEISDQQYRLIHSLGAEVIVIPDQDSAGLVLYDHAILHDWAVASPNWDDDIKDCADAVNRYGKLFVIVDAIKTAEKGAIKLSMAKKRLEQKIQRINNEKDN